jgi:hypothetical protein
MIISKLVFVISFLISATIVVPVFAGDGEEEDISIPGFEEEETLDGSSDKVLITLDNANFTSLTTGEGNQAGAYISYTIEDSSIVGQTINAVMEVYAPNGTLIRTTSYPNGFIAQNSDGKAELKTTITDQRVESVTANITFTDLNKTDTISNELTANLDLTSTTSTTTPVATGEAGEEEESNEEEDISTPGFEEEEEEEEEDISTPGFEEEEEEEEEDISTPGFEEEDGDDFSISDNF